MYMYVCGMVSVCLCPQVLMCACAFKYVCIPQLVGRVLFSVADVVGMSVEGDNIEDSNNNYRRERTRQKTRMETVHSLPLPLFPSLFHSFTFSRPFSLTLPGHFQWAVACCCHGTSVWFFACTFAYSTNSFFYECFFFCLVGFAETALLLVAHMCGFCQCVNMIRYVCCCRCLPPFPFLSTRVLLLFSPFHQPTKRTNQPPFGMSTDHLFVRYDRNRFISKPSPSCIHRSRPWPCSRLCHSIFFNFIFHS